MRSLPSLAGSRETSRARSPNTTLAEQHLTPLRLDPGLGVGVVAGVGVLLGPAEDGRAFVAAAGPGEVAVRGLGELPAIARRRTGAFPETAGALHAGHHRGEVV